EQLPDRAVRGHGVAGGLDAPVAEAAALVGGEGAAEVEVRLSVGLLVLVLPLAIGLPGLDRRPGDGLPVEIADPAGHLQRLADAVERDRGAGGVARRGGAVEWAARRVGRGAL